MALIRIANITQNTLCDLASKLIRLDEKVRIYPSLFVFQRNNKKYSKGLKPNASFNAHHSLFQS